MINPLDDAAYKTNDPQIEDLKEAVRALRDTLQALVNDAVPIVSVTTGIRTRQMLMTNPRLSEIINLLDQYPEV